ncbi:MAG: helix-turn-helix domain-containing protein [Propionicimonas sp.]
MLSSAGKTPTRKVTRAERALSTRRRMVRAAYDLFCQDGYLGTTIAAVAERAGVAVPTMYYSFGTKANLLDAALGAAVIGFDRWTVTPPDPQVADLMPMNTWWAPFHEAPTSHDALALFVQSGAQILRRVAPLMPAMHGAAGDADAAHVVRIAFERQADSYRHTLAVVASKAPGLRPGIDVEAGTDALLGLFSAEVYHTLSGRGWTHQRCTAFFQELLAAHLLPTP